MDEQREAETELDGLDREAADEAREQEALYTAWEIVDGGRYWQVDDDV